MALPTEYWNKEFKDEYYLQVYKLSKDGYDDREIAERMKPPVRYTTFLKWKRSHKAFEVALDQGRRERDPDQDLAVGIRNPRQIAFLMAYVEEGSITKAARKCGISPVCHNKWMTERKNNEQYQMAFETAKQLFADTLVAEAIKRGRDGRRSYKFYKGQPILMPCDKDHPEAQEYQDDQGNVFYAYHYYESSRSDTLLIKLLEAKVDEFKPESSNTSVTVNNGVVIQDMLDQAERARDTIIDDEYIQAVAETTMKLPEKKDESQTG